MSGGLDIKTALEVNPMGAIIDSFISKLPCGKDIESAIVTLQTRIAKKTGSDDVVDALNEYRKSIAGVFAKTFTTSGQEAPVMVTSKLIDEFVISSLRFVANSKEAPGDVYTEAGRIAAEFCSPVVLAMQSTSCPSNGQFITTPNSRLAGVWQYEEILRRIHSSGSKGADRDPDIIHFLDVFMDARQSKKAPVAAIDARSTGWIRASVKSYADTRHVKHKPARFQKHPLPEPYTRDAKTGEYVWTESGYTRALEVLNHGLESITYAPLQSRIRKELHASLRLLSQKREQQNQLKQQPSTAVTGSGGTSARKTIQQSAAEAARSEPATLSNESRWFLHELTTSRVLEREHRSETTGFQRRFTFLPHLTNSETFQDDDGESGRKSFIRGMLSDMECVNHVNLSLQKAAELARQDVSQTDSEMSNKKALLYWSRARVMAVFHCLCEVWNGIDQPTPGRLARMFFGRGDTSLLENASNETKQAWKSCLGAVVNELSKFVADDLLGSAAETKLVSVPCDKLSDAANCMIALFPCGADHNNPLYLNTMTWNYTAIRQEAFDAWNSSRAALVRMMVMRMAKRWLVSHIQKVANIDSRFEFFESCLSKPSDGHQYWSAHIPVALDVFDPPSFARADADQFLNVMPAQAWDAALTLLSRQMCTTIRVHRLVLYSSTEFIRCLVDEKVNEMQKLMKSKETRVVNPDEFVLNLKDALEIAKQKMKQCFVRPTKLIPSVAAAATVTAGIVDSKVSVKDIKEFKRAVLFPRSLVRDPDAGHAFFVLNPVLRELIDYCIKPQGAEDKRQITETSCDVLIEILSRVEQQLTSPTGLLFKTIRGKLAPVISQIRLRKGSPTAEADVAKLHLSVARETLRATAACRRSFDDGDRKATLAAAYCASRNLWTSGIIQPRGFTVTPVSEDAHKLTLSILADLVQCTVHCTASPTQQIRL